MNKCVQTPLEAEQAGQKLRFSYNMIIVSYRNCMELDKSSWDGPNGLRHELSL